MITPRSFSLLLLLATLAPAADAQTNKGITFELMGENPTVLIGQDDHFTDYGAVCLDEVRQPDHACACTRQCLTHTASVCQRTHRNLCVHV